MFGHREGKRNRTGGRGCAERPAPSNSCDRDINAATNILAAGHAVSACGVDGRPKGGYALNGSQRRSRKPKE